MWLAGNTLSTMFGETYIYTNTSYSTNGGIPFIYTLFLWIISIISIIAIVAMWKIFVKAGEEGWKSLIPFYNTYTLFRIAGRNGWGFILLFIPIVNLVVMIMLSIDLAKHFGKDAVFGVISGLFFFSIIGYLVLAFGDAKYIGPKHT